MQYIMPANDDLTWTTSRCNRLLRHISSPIAALRKEREKQQRAAGEARNVSTAFATKSTPRKTTNFSQLANPRMPRGFDKARDPDWVPGAKPGVAYKKTYGGRAAKKSKVAQRIDPENGNVGRPGEIAFTPLIARTGSRFQESPQMQASPLRHYTKKRGPLIAKAKHMRNLKKQMPQDIGKLVEGLLNAYANLLSVTAAGEEKRWTGTRSLMGACLRKLPAFIELEEHFVELDKEDDDDDEGRDISNEIYTELEDKFETRAGQGWRPFKSIVRAHGTSLLCDAFADQVLTLETLYLVISHCLNASAWDEAEKFLWTFLPALKPLSTPTNPRANLFDEQKSIYMCMVKDFVDRAGRARFLYDILEHMIAQGILPLEWLATECMLPVWHGLVRTLSDGDHRTLENALRFFETAICAGIGLPDDSLLQGDEFDIVSKQMKPSTRQDLRMALDTTFSSLLTLLTSIALLNQNRADSADKSTVQRVTWALDSIVIGLLKRDNVRSDLDLLDPTSENMQTFAQRALWTISASLIAHLGECRLDPSMISLESSTLVSAINWVVLQYSSEDINFSSIIGTLPVFISSAARCSGKAWKDDGFDQLQRLVDALLSLTGFRLPHKLWSMKRLALESCLEFAQSTNNAQHIAYVRQIEKSMKSKGHVVLVNSPHKNDSPSAGGGFRWEEGIGEWVACTPFAKQDVRHLPRKPMRALELLPTPVTSEDDREDSTSVTSGDERRLLGGLHNHNSVWEQDTGHHDYASPHSSPVRASSRNVSTRKRRGTSPMVVVPVKRTRIASPESPASLYTSFGAELRRSHRSLTESFHTSEPSVSSEIELRRSRRSRKEVVSSLCTLRSRSSIDNSLRNIGRKAYEEVVDVEESESERDDSVVDVDEAMSDEDDRDELGKTPAGLKRQRSCRLELIKKPRSGRWSSRAHPVDDEGSEDELSFQ